MVIHQVYIQEIDMSHNSWTTEEKVLLKKLHKKHTVRELSDKLDKSEQGVRRQLHRNNLSILSPINKDLNETFFSKWSHDMSYCLGFLMADGSIGLNEWDNYYLACQIHKKDREILDFILNKLDPTRKPIEIIATQKSGLITPKVSIKITSKQLCKDLIKLNVVPRKTGQEKLPNIPKKYLSDYIRGYFDGDGNIYYNKKTRYYRFRIDCSTKSFLEDMKASIGLGKIYKGHGTFVWEITKIKEICEIYKIMYKSNNFCLNRKKEKFSGITTNTKYIKYI